jgi:CHAD domain-containing protein
MLQEVNRPPTAHMNEKPALRADIPLADELRAIARDILDQAHKVLDDQNRPAAAAVHDFRKALKRWRALLRLLAPYLGDGGTLRKDARDVAHRLTGARDQQAALEALEDIFKEEQPGFSARSQETLRARLEEARQAAEGSTLSPETRERLRASLAVAADATARWPLEALTFRDIARRLAATYRRARRLIPSDWAHADPEHLHELRKRVIEHRYQMELVEPLWPRLGRVWVDEAQRLRERLGRCQDLEVLRHTTDAHRPLAHWRSRLSTLIAARRDVHLSSAARVAARLFAEKPKAFRRRIESLWERRRDRAADDSAGRQASSLGHQDDERPLSASNKLRITASRKRHGESTNQHSSRGEARVVGSDK